MYHRILVPLDGSVTAERALREAIDLAVDQKARLCLLHVVDSFPTWAERSSAKSYAETLSRLVQQGEEILAKARQSATEAGAITETLLHEVTQETVADVIVNTAERARCDLIVMGTHGRRGLSRLTLGSDAELVLRSSKVPVLLLRQTDPKLTVV